MPLVGHAGCPRVRFVDASAPSLEKTKKFSNQDSNSEPLPCDHMNLPSRPLEQICKMKICLGFCTQKCFWKIGGVPKWPKTSFDSSRPLLTRLWGVATHFRGWPTKVCPERRSLCRPSGPRCPAVVSAMQSQCALSHVQSACCHACAASCGGRETGGRMLLAVLSIMLACLLANHLLAHCTGRCLWARPRTHAHARGESSTRALTAHTSCSTAMLHYAK